MLSSLSPLAMAAYVSQGKAPASSAPSLSHAGKVRSSALMLLRTSHKALRPCNCSGRRRRCAMRALSFARTSLPVLESYNNAASSPNYYQACPGVFHCPASSASMNFIVKHTLAGHNHASSSSRVSWLFAHPIRLCSP